MKNQKVIQSQGSLLISSIKFASALALALVMTDLPTAFADDGVHAADMAILQSSKSTYEQIQEATSHLRDSSDPAIAELWLQILERPANYRARFAAETELIPFFERHTLPSSANARLLQLVENVDRDRGAASSSSRVLESMIGSGDRSIVPSVLSRAESPNLSATAKVRFANLLERSEDPRGAQTLIRWVQDSNSEVRTASMDAMRPLVATSVEVRGSIRSVLEDESNPRAQLRAISALSALRYTSKQEWLRAPDVKATLRSLAERLNDRSSDVRSDAAETLVGVVRNLAEKGVIGLGSFQTLARCIAPEGAGVLSQTSSRSLAGTRLLLDVLLFGGIPITSAAGGLPQHQAEHEAIRAALAQPWDAERMSGLNQLIDRL